MLEWMPGFHFSWHSDASGPAPLTTGVSRKLMALGVTVKAMRIIVEEPGPTGSGSGYPFTLSRWLTDEVRSCVKRSEWFEQEYGKNWSLSLLIMTNTRLRKPQVYKAKTNK